jgi:hypothetical protein
LASKPLQNNSEWGKMNGPGGASNATPGPRHATPVEEVPAMPFVGDYTDSAPSGNREQDSNTWKSLGDLAKALAEKAGGGK